MIEDKETYEPVSLSKQKCLEKQANNLMKSITKNIFSKREAEKLLSTGSQPAHFSAFIKDHKDRSEDGYPLRPIASVNGTATEKIDWLVSKILTALVKFVPSNVKNTDELTDLLDQHAKHFTEADGTFVSLDVRNLYPSIPLDFGIETTIAFAKQHWQNIKNFGLTLSQLESCLKFICYNYEIKFNDRVFKQRKGCPMGAHFSPPFAIITMSRIENEALERLEKSHIKPKIYKRYLDDILLGPIKENLATVILDTFNSIQSEIQFTVEVPPKNEFLAFLDIAIRIKDNNIQYKWHVKPCHSDNSLR